MNTKRNAVRRGRLLACILTVCLVLTMMPLASSAASFPAAGTTQLQTAINQAKAEDVITITSNIYTVKQSFVIPEGANVTIDLKGYSIYTHQIPTTDGIGNPILVNNSAMESKPIFLVNNGASLTIINTGNFGTILNRCDKGLAIINNGILTLQGGNISVSGKNGVCISNNGTMNLNGANVKAETKGSTAVKNSGTLNIKSGSINTEKADNSIGILNSGAVNLSGGTVTANSKATIGLQNNGGTVNVSGGFLYARGSEAGALVNDKGSVSQSGGYIDTVGSGWAVVNKGTYKMTGGDIAATGAYSVGVKAESGSFVLDKGTIRAAGNNSIAVLVQSGFTNNGGLITVTGTTPQAVVYGDGAAVPQPETQPGTSTPGTSASINAIPTPSVVIVNGERVGFDSYNINGNNYFKLRDLAYVLSGSEKQFDVMWDQANSSIMMFTGLPYTIVGGEMSSKGTANQTAHDSTALAYLDNARKDFKAYHIQGNNYFKLRDIGKAMDFGVFWDESTKTITIDTSKPYTE